MNQFVYYPVFSDRASDAHESGVRWMMRDEISAVKTTNCTKTDVTGHYRHLLTDIEKQP
jgi:hypothetical protein